jgi:hypothetical protein
VDYATREQGTLPWYLNPAARIASMFLRMRAFATLLIAIVATQAACNRSSPQKDFESAEAAAGALAAAVQSDDSGALLEVLGPQAESVLNSGDPVQDKNSRERFLRAYTDAHSLRADAAGMSTLEVGTDEWPFPFPIVQRNGRYRFDSAAGVEEIINRRIGSNELSAIQSCLAFVDAQREYYVRNAERDSLLHFAQKLASTPGRKDGLYWPTSGNELPSPLGEAFARARSEGYFEEGVSDATPYHGYVYRLLTSQGGHAAGGAYDYMVRNRMLGGFALLAFPVEYGVSGVMTFIVSHDGVVFSKDLGPRTATAVQLIGTFDPDMSWQREAAIR